MKQHITPKQIKKLSKKQAIKLTKWLKDKDYYNFYATQYGALLSIGQMIEFLDENDMIDTETGFDKFISWVPNEELCDVLWEAVKEVLNEI